MKIRLAVVALSGLAVLGACANGPGQTSGGSVQATVSTTATTAPSTTTSAPVSTTTTSAKPVTTTTTARPTTTTSLRVTTTTRATTNVVFANCTEAKAAGYHDILRGEPGYASKLDRDGDGIACES